MASSDHEEIEKKGIVSWLLDKARGVMKPAPTGTDPMNPSTSKALKELDDDEKATGG
jgi:hypothetical protein